jgi:SAM-dependent methyltransferase
MAALFEPAAAHAAAPSSLAPAPGFGPVYQSVNTAVLAQVPPAARTVLDVGCGGGAFGAALKATARHCRVVGLTHSGAEHAEASRRLDEVHRVDLDDADLGVLSGQRFDAVVCSHVLEHLRQPQTLLRALHAHVAPGGALVVALPNALHWRQRWLFLRGRFRYTDGGAMDRTHLRFFDWKTAQALLADSGWQVRESRADGHVPASRYLGRRLAPRVDRFGLAHWPGLLGAQFVLRAEAGEFT